MRKLQNKTVSHERIKRNIEEETNKFTTTIIDGAEKQEQTKPEKLIKRLIKTNFLVRNELSLLT